MINFQDAFRIITTLSPLEKKIKSISIYQSQGYILAQDIHSRRPLPPFTHSAMDGYALHSTQKPPFKITDTILAGTDASKYTLHPQEALRIMTGAMLPNCADCVVPFENAQIKDSLLTPLISLKKGQNIRYEGEELKSGELIAKAGDELDFRLLGILASQGFSEISVFEKLKIGIFSSGNEVQELGSPIKDYQVYNINAVAILSLLHSFGFDCHYLGVLKDDKNLENELLSQCQKYDILITSGGASVGDADLFYQVLQKNHAKILFNKINLKPGKPFMLASLQNTYLYCLPGNPLSAISNLLSLVLPSLKYLSYSRFFYPKTITAHLDTPLYFKAKRTHILQGFYHDSVFSPHQNGKINANAFSTFHQCNAFAIFDEQRDHLEAGSKIRILPYRLNFDFLDSSPINL